MGRHAKDCTCDRCVERRATGVSEPVEDSSPDVRPQITELSGFSSAADLADVIPESTSSTNGEPDGPKKARKPRKSKTNSAPALDPDDPMNDPEYKKAIQRLTGMGGQKLTAMPFDVWAMMAHDPKLALSDEEKKDWAAMWYIISKKANMVPDSWLGIGITASMLLTTQVGQRFAQTTDAPAMLKKYFGIEISKEEFEQAKGIIKA